MSTASTVDRVDQVDPIERVTQRRVPAAQAPRPATTGPSSVFALASAAGPAVDDAAAPTNLEDQAAQAFKARGPRLGAPQVGQALNISAWRAKQLLLQMVRDGVLVEAGMEGRTPLYMLKPASRSGLDLGPGELQGWLAKQGQHTATPRQERRRQRKAVTTPAATGAEMQCSGDLVASAAGVHVVTLQKLKTMITPDPEAPLCLGLYSTGEIAIERGAERMRLNPQQARQLVDWALRADLLLPA